jgi:hypothetical protein
MREMREMREKGEAGILERSGFTATLSRIRSVGRGTVAVVLAV